METRRTMKTRRVESKLIKGMKTKYSFLKGIIRGPTTAREALTDLRKGIKENTPTGKDKYIKLSGEKNGFFDLQNSPVSVIYDLLNFLISKKESTHWYSFLQSVIEGKEAKSKDSFFLEDKKMTEKSKIWYGADPPAFTTGGLLNAIEGAREEVFVETSTFTSDVTEVINDVSEVERDIQGEEELVRAAGRIEEMDARRRDDDEERARLEHPF